MGLFGPSLPIDRDEFDWLLACFAWLHRETGKLRVDDGACRTLAHSAMPEFCETTSASELFDAVKTIAGLGAWHCVLEQGVARPASPGAGQLGQFSERYALGTFAIEANTPVIRYDPHLLSDPDALTATFAHELAHLLIATLGDPPGGEDLHEHVTDCVAVYLGFGVFLANSARRFAQFQDGLVGGWSSSVSGYLSERSLVTATALFVRLWDCDPDPAIAALKPYLKKDFRQALKYIDRHYPELARTLDDIDLRAWIQD